MALTDKLTAVADAIRAKTGKADEMTLDQMPDEIASIRGGGNIPVPVCVASVANDISHNVESVVNVGVAVSVTAEHYHMYALYNGVRLPRIPEDVLKNYPYAWIRNNANSNVYELVYFPNGGYFDGSAVYDKGPVHGPRYQIARNADMDTATWEYVDSTYSGYTIDGNRTVLWSNHDIPNGSATATDIYFAGSKPVLTD